VRIGKRADFGPGIPAESLLYTVSVTNSSFVTLTNLVLTDSVPAETGFLSASDGGVEAGGTITWTVDRLPYPGSLQRTFTVTIAHLPRGMVVSAHAPRIVADPLPEAVSGTGIDVIVPWRVVLFPIFKEWGP